MNESGKSAREQMQLLAEFMRDTDAESERQLADAREQFGHPVNWPRPPRTMPRWYQISLRRQLRAADLLFGPMSQEDLDAFYSEKDKGQSVYEDAGGYLLRCYRALVALSVEEPYTYDSALSDFLTKAGIIPT